MPERKVSERDEEKASVLDTAGGRRDRIQLVARFAPAIDAGHAPWEDTPHRWLRVEQDVIALEGGELQQHTEYAIRGSVLLAFSTTALMWAVYTPSDCYAGLVWLQFSSYTDKSCVEQALKTREPTVITQRLCDVPLLAGSMAERITDWSRVEQKEQQQQPRDDTMHGVYRDVRDVEREQKERAESRWAAPTQVEV